MNAIGSRISELISQTGLSHAEFAEQINISTATVSHILKGRNKPSLQVVLSIKERFTNVNTDYLLLGTGALFEKAPAGPKVEQSEAAIPPMGGGFPMEGVRKVSLAGAPQDLTPQQVKTASTLSEGIASDEETLHSAPTKAQTTSIQNRTGEDSEIERVIIFYKDGRFKAFHP